MASTHNNEIPRYSSAHECHLRHVFGDPDFAGEVQSSQIRLKMGEITDARHQKERLYTARRWAISLNELGLYEIGKIIPLEPQISNASLRSDPTRLNFSIAFNHFATRAEILEQWTRYETIRNELFPSAATKRKPPADPRLIYAVFKARQHDETFPSIYRQYSNGTLPEYVGDLPRNQFASSALLERHYNRYKPDA